MQSPLKSSQQTITLPTLKYYRIRGLGQPIRNLLYHLQVQFNDNRLDKNSPEISQLQTLESTFNSGLPQFKDGDVIISDCVAIAIYICQKNGANSLTGASLQKKAKVNEVLFKYWMEKTKVMPAIFQIIFSIAGIPQINKIPKVREMLKKLIKTSKFLAYCLKMHRVTESWIHHELTLVDFYFYETAYYVKGFFQSYIANDELLALFLSFCKKFQALKFHEIYKNKIKEVKIFFPFDQQRKNQILISAWDGQENIIYE